jgi:3-carboxy-cis,cis-muconate cycloisomerase
MLRDPLFTDPELTPLFSDDTLIAAMLQFEAALARVEARMNVIPPEAASAIEAAAGALTVDRERIRAGMRRDGVPTIALIAQLREAIDPRYRAYAHHGATTQDVIDTALVLIIRQALDVLNERISRIMGVLARLADAHRTTIMVGRTHSQHAQPITFGFKAAGWLAPFVRHRQRWQELRARVLVLQLGGAVGTTAALGDEGIAIHQALAAELELHPARIAWFTARDGFAEVGAWLSLVSGSAAKIAQDVILMAQSEIGEVRESMDGGGSSVLAHKHNPIVSETIIAAARANTGHLAALHNALIQEHERAAGGWQIEWLTLPPMFTLTGAALLNLLAVLEGIQVNTARMREHVNSAQGTLLSEAIERTLSAHLPPAEVKLRVREASEIALAQQKALVDVLKDMLDESLWLALEPWRDAAAYLGSADRWIDQVLDGV